MGAELAILVQDVSINANFQLLGKGVKRHASAPNYFVITSLGVTFIQVCNKSNNLLSLETKNFSQKRWTSFFP